MPNELELRVIRMVARRIVPFVMIQNLVSFVARVNIGFGGGVFYPGYFLVEVPSNLLLHRRSARIRIARVMTGWAVV